MLDSSFACQWLFEDESTPEADAALAAIRLGGATVPALWPFEITNVLGIAERRGRLTQGGVAGALALLRTLPLHVVAPLTLDEAETVLDLMRRYRLSGYDATYLELAMRLRLPLATKDGDLLVAAPAAGVALFGAAS
ncbi:MAG: type II toxin-antitoxin system VapC family toxin [Acetobacteraceae bacterium]|nr:type II toxin-antitoxin system VapC family toxin [Acetobacteraceae bacterium]